MTIAGATTVCLELRSETALPQFTAGSHIDVHIAPGIIRQYSLCNSPTERHRYLVCVHRENQGRGGSRTMHDSIRVGQQLTISRPRNNFDLAAGDHYILIAGGIGITPLLAMAHQLLADKTSFELHVYARDRQHLPLAEVLAEPTLRDHVHIHLSDDGDSLRHGPPTALTESEGGMLVYTCGPNDFMDAVADYATAGGLPPEQVRRERFAPKPVALSEVTPNSGFDVVIASTGQRLPVAPEQRIADVLLDAGINIEMSCEQGMCGACLTGVLSGIPEHHDDIQSDTERAANNQLTICCSRSQTNELVLDL